MQNFITKLMYKMNLLSCNSALSQYWLAEKKSFKTLHLSFIRNISVIQQSISNKSSIFECKVFSESIKFHFILSFMRYWASLQVILISICKFQSIRTGNIFLEKYETGSFLRTIFINWRIYCPWPPIWNYEVLPK